MCASTRRQFIGAATAMPLALWLGPAARASTALVRYDASSREGIAMLKVYAHAVRQMQAAPEASPLGWMWQWYTHFVKGTTTKSDEVARLFGTQASALRSLANATWDTCQSHSGQDYRYFLPWHRMYTCFFERIVRQVSGRADFTMPYWDYTSDDPAKRGILPLQFRLPNDPVFGSLYRPDRSVLANTGQRIDQLLSRDGMDIGKAMAKAGYSDVGTTQGFCRAINSGIHGNIHVLVGTARDMGSVPFAGNDPLFWVHHANIDRMWASWNAAGGANPAAEPWASKRFTFADEYGQAAQLQIAQVFDIAALGYRYQAGIPTPAKARFDAVAPAGAGNAVAERIAAAHGETDLGARAVHVPLLPVPGNRNTTVLGLDPSAPRGRTCLVLRGLHAWSQPEVLYEIHVRPGGGGERLDADNVVGTINFFDAEFHDHGGGAMGDALADNVFSFDVTERLRRYQRSGTGAARDSLLVSIVPAGRPTGGQPMIGAMELVRQ